MPEQNFPLPTLAHSVPRMVENAYAHYREDNLPLLFRRTAIMSHARLRLADDFIGDFVWDQTKNPTLAKKIFLHTEVKEHDGQFIFWGMFNPDLWTRAAIASLSWLEITAPNPAHKTGIDALVFRVKDLAERQKAGPFPGGLTYVFQALSAEEITGFKPEGRAQPHENHHRTH